MKEGIRYTATHPGIAALLVLLIALGVGGRPLNELLPGFAADVFQGGGGRSRHHGLDDRRRRHSRRRLARPSRPFVGHDPGDARQCSLATALAAIAVVATDRLWAALPALFVFGFSMSTSGIAIQTLIQLASARAMRGRVMGLYGLIFRGSPAVGALGAGIVSAHIGLRWTVFFGALLVIATWLWCYLVRERIAAALERLNATDAPDHSFGSSPL